MQRTVCVVDDLPDNIALIQEIFSDDSRLKFISATNGMDFLDHARREGYPDLLLLDLMMPEMDGFAVLDAIRSAREKTYFPVMVISGVADKSNVIKALSRGADDYVSKPFYAEELRLRVSNMLKIKERDECLNVSLDVMESNLIEKLHMLEGTQLETILKLGTAAEFRDDETGRHIERISEYVHLIAHHLGLGKEQSLMMKYAAPMHDVGKIGIPDGLLLKPGKLTDEEFKIIRLHTVIGAKILSGTTLPLLEIAREIALSHHEKWDGSGYPFNLSGSDIPLSGRIVAVTDVFDALTSNRVYKSAWTIERTLDFIREQRGQHFDPDIVDAFFAVADAIVAVKLAKGDVVEKPLMQQILDGDVTIDEFVERWR